MLPLALTLRGGPMRHQPTRASAPVMQIPPAEPPHVAVIGAGWGGWGAAKALVENGCRVTLLDALPDPTGKTPYLTPSGKPFEAGTRGFWFDYPNINSLVTNELGLLEVCAAAAGDFRVAVEFPRSRARPRGRPWAVGSVHRLHKLVLLLPRRPRGDRPSLLPGR